MTTIADLAGKTDDGPKVPLADQGRSDPDPKPDTGIGTDKETGDDGSTKQVVTHKEEERKTTKKKTRRKRPGHNNPRTGKLISDLEKLRASAQADVDRIDGALKELKKGA